MIINERNLIKRLGAFGCFTAQQLNEQQELRDYSPAGFLGRDDNLHRFVGNAFPNATDPSGLYTKDPRITGGHEERLKDNIVIVDWTKNLFILVKAYTDVSGFVDRNQYNGDGMRIQFITNVPDAYQRIHFLQFSMRSFTLKKGVNDGPINYLLQALDHTDDEQAKLRNYYVQWNRWRVDTASNKSLWYDYRGPVGHSILSASAQGDLLNQTSGWNADRIRHELGHDTLFEESIFDRPGFFKEADFQSEKTSFRTYVVYGGKLVYEIKWNRSIERDNNGTWGNPKYAVTDSRTLFEGDDLPNDFPMDATSKQWLWGYEDSNRKSPVTIPTTGLKLP